MNKRLLMENYLNIARLGKKVKPSSFNNNTGCFCLIQSCNSHLEDHKFRNKFSLR